MHCSPCKSIEVFNTYSPCCRFIVLTGYYYSYTLIWAGHSVAFILHRDKACMADPDTLMLSCHSDTLRRMNVIYSRLALVISDGRCVVPPMELYTMLHVRTVRSESHILYTSYTPSCNPSHTTLKERNHQSYSMSPNCITSFCASFHLVSLWNLHLVSSHNVCVPLSALCLKMCHGDAARLASNLNAVSGALR